MGHSFSQMYFHIVFGTQNREPWFIDSVRFRLLPYLGGIVGEEGGAAIGVGGTDDHVHILCSIGPTRSMADFLRVLKANSSKWLHDSFAGMEAFAWQRGYGVFSVSHSNVPAAKRYIERQVEHHQAVSFRDEMIQLLDRHGVEYDKRYLLA